MSRTVTKIILSEGIDERNRQEAKWGEQNHPAFTYLAILGEEVGEANQAALQATFGGMTQNGTVARFWGGTGHSSHPCACDSVQWLDTPPAERAWTRTRTRPRAGAGAGLR